ncbi:Demethylmenaquinone methyltransferase [Polystyrenella longa]|uniref:Demethylmenaquinone methyltransferase n=1 Tax=Polystyrenella longa TaxID=2528007 RepID=A0A518CLT2_9PLAN|nr:class I SAM-dependent methyltransferase [Polystyrenella longa]QDU80182.1 Demethylmenaquinone methyltransferase [Polystyrenella longa]
MLRRVVEFNGIRRLPFEQYRDHVQQHYDGPAGAVLTMASMISLHEPLIGHLIRGKKFDVSQRKSLLDVGSGAGQVLGHLLKEVDIDANFVAFDLSQKMLRRARLRVKDERPNFISGDLMQLPFADESFDCITCGWVIEHLPDPIPGLKEMGRVLAPGGSILIMTTEDTFAGAMTSRTWKCRTYNRKRFQEACVKAGLQLKAELWFSKIHRFFRMGGILVELTRDDIRAITEDETTSPNSDSTPDLATSR